MEMCFRRKEETHYRRNGETKGENKMKRKSESKWESAM